MTTETQDLDLNGFVELGDAMSASGKGYYRSLGRGEIQVYKTRQGRNRWVRAFVVDHVAMSSRAYATLQAALLDD